jgi:uncharacterized protein (TIGR00369 family)
MTTSVRGAGKTYGTVSVQQQKELTGLQFVQGLVDGTLPLNTMAGTLGYDVIEVAPGRVVVAIEPNGQHLNPSGTVHGGLAAILLDTCMGLAIRTTHDRGVASTTLEFKISLVRPIMPGTPDQSRGRRSQLRPPRRHRRRTDHGPRRTVARSWHDDVPDFSDRMSRDRSKAIETRACARSGGSPSWRIS